MAPKAKTPAVALPVEDPLVELPEHIDVPDPPFSFILAHLVSHVFCVEPPVEAADGEPPDALQDFDPLDSLSRFHEGGEAPNTSNILLLQRDELEAFAEGGTLAAGLRRKAEAEAACRKRKKVNEARQKARQEDAGESHEPGDSGEATEAAEDHGSHDFTLIVSGYPSTPEEVAELEAAELFDLADAWVSLHLSGETCIDEPDDLGGTKRIIRVIGAPPAVTTLREKVVAAEAGSPFATSIVTELHNCHEWATRPTEVPDPSEVVLAAISSAAEHRITYKEWIESLPEERVVIPDLSSDASSLDTSVYERLVESTDPSRHDVSFMLYCLCEQVNQSLKGNVAEAPSQRKKPSEAQMKALQKKELSMIEKFLDNASDILLFGQDAVKEVEEKNLETIGSLMAMVEQEEQQAENGSKEEAQHVPGMAPDPGLGSSPPEDLEEMVIPFHDRMSSRHVGHHLPGGKSVALEIEQLLSHLNAPGIDRQNFPRRISMTAAERSAHRNRIYKYMPSMPVVELERLLLLREFQELLHHAQPERHWNLQDWIFQEKIPASLLCQTLLDASCRDYFVDMKYMERQDCLLVAMHHRALPGRVLWHSWEGDLLTLAAKDSETRSEMKLCPVPTFNDWWQLVSGQPSPAPPAYTESEEGFTAVPSRKKAKKRKEPKDPNATQKPGLEAPACPKKVLDLDAREVGYCKAIEKILVPSDRSIILRTAYQRGVQNCVPELAKDGKVLKPVVEDDDGEGEDSGQEEEIDDFDPFVPLPRKELHSVRVIKDNMTFGMVSDAAWLETVEAMRNRVSVEEPAPPEEDEDAKRAEALRAAQGIADGEEEGEEPVEQEPQEEEEGEQAINITERYMEESKFGCLWIVFKDGTRCTVRMHHERLWYTPGDVSWDVTSSRPGVQVTYTPPSGVVVQAFSDASIRQSWPPQRLFPMAGLEADEMLPGQAQDIELARQVTAFGVLVIERLSGRKDVHHPSGTRAWRNPTIEELQERTEHFKALATKKGCDVAARACAERMAQICAAWEANQDEEDEMDPSEQNKYFGMPGHWRVTTSSGRRFGRALKVEEASAEPGTATGSRSASQRNSAEVDKISKEIPGSHGTGSRPGSKVPSSKDPGSKQPSKDIPAEAEDDEDLESEPEPPEPPPSLQDILEAVLVDEGNNIEYELDPVPMLVQRDPHTGITSTSNEEGMLILSYPDGESNVCILPDGTRVSQTVDAEGSEVVVEKEGAARVTCYVKDKAYVPHSMVKVEIEDGATMEVVPRRLNLKAELVAADPHAFLAKLRGEPEEDVSPALEIAQQQNAMSQHEFCRNPDPREDSYSTNASVILRHLEGTLVHSKGAGEVELVSGRDIATIGSDNEKALKTLQDKGCVYLAQVDYDRIYLRDDDGNHFEVKGDQSLDFKLSVSMGDDFASPRCVVPKRPFKHPDASFLPLPEEAPQPRLFVVYGDGEAEELLLKRDFEEAIRLAQKDPLTLVVAGEKMGWPMSCCKTHSIHRIMHMDPVSVPVRPLELPPGICGCVEPPAMNRTFTQFRQFIEYPEITDQKLKDWESAYELYRQEEEEQRVLQSTLGEGLKNARRSMNATLQVEQLAKMSQAAASEPAATEASEQARDGGA